MENAKTTNIFHAILLAFYSKKFYREVASVWRVKSFLYLLLLLALCWAIVGLAKGGSFINSLHVELLSVSQQIPVIRFDHGVASTTQPGVVYIKWPAGEKVVAIVDVHNQLSGFENTSARVIFQKDHMLVKSFTGATTVKNYSKDLTTVFGPKQFRTVLAQAKKWFFPVVFMIALLLGFVVSTIYRLIEALIYALIGKVFGFFSKHSVKYGTAYRLTLVAVTPAIVLGTLLSLFRIHFPYQWLFYFVLSMGYLFFAITSAKQEKV